MEVRLTKETLQEWVQENLGMNYLQAREDNSGCYISSRGGHWLSPKVMCEVLEGVLEEIGLEVSALVEGMQEDQEIVEHSMGRLLEREDCFDLGESETKQIIRDMVEGIDYRLVNVIWEKFDEHR